jgi:U6 snRNA-associated Sm-like protein LSm1
MSTSIDLITSLDTYLDQQLLVILRDGRNLVGTLKSYDQFSNLVLQDTIERIMSAKMYADIPRGIFLIRGENLVFMGAIDDTSNVSFLEKGEIEDVLQRQADELYMKEKHRKGWEMIVKMSGSIPEMETTEF